MKKPKLTPRQRTFAEYCRRSYVYRTHTDAYIAVYNSKGSRKTATANASRIYNKPAVQAYLEELDQIRMQRAVDNEIQDRKAFLATL